MKNKINIDVETVRLIYTKYRKHITYGGIIAVSLIVFVFVLPKYFRSQVSVKHESLRFKNFRD